VTELLKGLAIGFAIAATVGPIWLLCFRRAVAEGPLTGFVAGLGVATADGLYGLVAAFGLTALSDFMLNYRLALGLGGGLFLCWLGIQAFFARPVIAGATPARASLAGAYFSTTALTLANPMTILSFAAVAAGMGLAATPDYGAAARLTAGIFTGSMLWWALLSAGTAMLRTRLNENVVLWINRVSGAVIFAFGVWQIARSASG